MALSRLLPLLLLVPALTMADEDKNFKVTSDYFKVGSVLDHPSKVAIVMDSALAISQEPVFPLQRNKLYLRYKNSVKEYLWFSGDVKLEDYKKLHAFSLKDNHLGVREVLDFACMPLASTRLSRTKPKFISIPSTFILHGSVSSCS